MAQLVRVSGQSSVVVGSNQVLGSEESILPMKIISVIH